MAHEKPEMALFIQLSPRELDHQEGRPNQKSRAQCCFRGSTIGKDTSASVSSVEGHLFSHSSLFKRRDWEELNL
jgi:hypothetical protein